MTTDWHDGEYDDCRRLVRDCGDDAVGREPKTIATYLQAAHAFRDGEYEISARLTTHHGAGVVRVIYDGPASGAPLSEVA